MTRERRRAALAALCVLAVVLAAFLFPAGGFGSYPSGVGTGGHPDDSTGGVSGSDPPDETAPTETTDSEDPTTDGEDGPTETTTETTTTETTTATTTETTTAAGESGPGSAGGFVYALVVAVFLVSFGVVGFGFWSGILAVSRTTSGAAPLPFTVTVSGTPVGELVGAIPARTMGLVVGLSAAVPRLLDDAAALTRAVAGSFGAVLGAVGRGAGGALRIGLRGLGATLTAVPRALAGLGAGAGVLSNVSRPSLGLGGRGRASGRESAGRSETESEPAETGPPSVEEAWAAMSETVKVRNREARTPAEIARAAVERGYPDEAVRRLTDAFREVRYGGLPRSDRTEAARAALDRLRDHWRDDE